jgi:hypothetical protein
VTLLNGHIHQIMQKVEGNVTFHTAMAAAFGGRPDWLGHGFQVRSTDLLVWRPGC